MIKEELKKEAESVLKLLIEANYIFLVKNEGMFKFKGLTDSNRKKYLARDEKIEYNIAYTKAQKIISIILSERLTEFEECYRIKNRKKDLDISNYDISLGLEGIYRYGDSTPFIKQTHALMKTQIAILRSALDILDSKLFDIQGELQYNLFMDELSTAQHLLDKKYLRPAGVVAGVILESHLKSVCINHSLKIGKKDTLSNYNDNLKTNNVIDTTNWKKILFLSDIRNLCSHKGDREATKEEVQDLIIGVKSIVSNIS